MSGHSSYYHCAAFRTGVDFLVGDTRAVFSYDLVSFDVELNAPAAAQVERLCEELSTEDGLTINSVQEKFGPFTPHVWKILGAFDKYGFLTERNASNAERALSGALFWTQVEAFANRAKVHFKPVLYPALVSGTVTKPALLRYALEYFHLVRNGPSIIAGMLPHVSTENTRTLIEQFLCQEIGHEKLLLQSLRAGGISESFARSSVPLPETFSLIAGLQTLSDQDPLSFKAVAFLLEESSADFHTAFRNASERVGLGQDFWFPIVRHAEINDDGDHEQISARLLADVPLVREEERIVVLKHVATMIETLIALEHSVLDHRNGLLPESMA